MEYITYSNFRTKIINDMQLDLDDTTGFITDAELVDYVNEALDDAESVIHDLGLDATYFRVVESTKMSLVSGTDEYDLPSDIYGHKILRCFYISGSRKYPVQRIRNPNETLDIQNNEDFRYLLVNRASGASVGVKQKFYPTPSGNESQVIERWYIRNVRKVTSALTSDNTIEIPEAHNFIYQHVKYRIYEKEGSPLLGKAERDLKRQYDLMVSSLRVMVPDEDNLIEGDYSHYEESALENVWY